MWLLVLMLPLACGGMLAEDRLSGYLALRVTRGASRRLVALSHVLVVAVLGAISTLISVGAICVAAVSANSVAAASVGKAVSFVPTMLESRPVAWAFVVAGVYALACTASLVFSALVGVWRTTLTARVVPPVTMLALGFVLTGPLVRLSPFERASFLQVFGAEWVAPGPMVAYWGALALGAAAAFVAGFSAKEA